MRRIAVLLSCVVLSAAPLFSGDASDPSPKARKDHPATPAPGDAVRPAEPEPSETAAIEIELQDLRGLVERQMRQLEAQRTELAAQREKVERLEASVRGKLPEDAVESTAVTALPAEPARAALAAAPAMLPAVKPPQGGGTENSSPLYFKIGSAEFYPLGFMDLTSIFRTTNVGGIGTGFGAIPFGNTVAGRTSENRFTAQNSRVGLRVSSKVGRADVTGYLETDFLGFLAPNGHDTSNSDSLRLRLFWVDYRRGKFEILAGQSWSFLTPNRVGLSAMPSDLFYTQDVDTNYQLGLTWTRQAQMRFILHPTKNWALGVSLENPQQTLPGSVRLPSTVPSPAGANYGGQFDTNSGNTSSATAVNNTSVPNLHPDVIVKSAWDVQPGGRRTHFEVAGLFRTFKAVNLVATPATPTAANTVTSTIHGGGVAGSFSTELARNFRFLLSSFYSYGGGRYIGSTAGPDLIVRPDGNLSGVHSGSGIGGFEYQVSPKWMVYGYYSGAYFGRNVGTVASDGGTEFSGYGFPGSPSSANRYIQEPTVGIVQTFWKNPMYGDLKLMTQYSYVSRAPWSVAPGTPATAHTSMVYVNLRYDLP